MYKLDALKSRSRSKLNSSGFKAFHSAVQQHVGPEGTNKEGKHLFPLNTQSQLFVFRQRVCLLDVFKRG